MKRNLVGKSFSKINIFVHNFVPIRTALRELNLHDRIATLQNVGLFIHHDEAHRQYVRYKQKTNYDQDFVHNFVPIRTALRELNLHDGIATLQNVGLFIHHDEAHRQYVRYKQKTNYDQESHQSFYAVS